MLRLTRCSQALVRPDGRREETVIPKFQVMIGQALTHLIPLVSQKEPENAMTSALLVSSLHVTDCISEERKSTSMPELPFELVELVIDYVLADMRSTKIGDTAAALLRVSSSVRYIVVKAFTPVKLYEVDPSPSPQEVTVHLDEKLVSFVASITRWHLADVSVQRHNAAVQPKEKVEVHHESCVSDALQLVTLDTQAASCCTLNETHALCTPYSRVSCVVCLAIEANASSGGKHWRRRAVSKEARTLHPQSKARDSDTSGYVQSFAIHYN